MPVPSLTSTVLVLAILMATSSIKAQSARQSMGSATAKNDTIIVHVFSFDDPSPSGWAVPYRGMAKFPENDDTYRKILMVQHLKCDPRTNHDSFPCGEWDYHTRYLINVPIADSIEEFELASFITPYGIRLDMGGSKGWKWIYDVTDYAPLLIGEREIVAGNNQELLDLSFIFIKGTPPRPVINVQNLYPAGLYKYQAIADDSALMEVSIPLRSDMRSLMVKARVSGHGHEGPRNCCEWDRKMHHYTVAGEERIRWEVWKDCGFNPIYPQGGTWPFDRAGWCPGTPVDEYCFELGHLFKSGDTLRIDYGIEAYRENGEKNGEFRMAHQLFQYGDYSYKRDAGLLEISAPSTSDAYSRVNPPAEAATIIVRNEGSQPVRSLFITYGIKGGPKFERRWTGELLPMQKAVIDVPFKGLDKYSGALFFATISEVNGSRDENPANDHLGSEIPVYPILPSEISIVLHSNNLVRAAELSMMLSDCKGAVLIDSAGFADDSTYRFDVRLSAGCYELILHDDKEDGMMRHWWYRRSDPEKVGISGSLKLLDSRGVLLKEFPADFGEKILYRFVVR
jgi:hypothetical protein